MYTDADGLKNGDTVRLSLHANVNGRATLRGKLLARLTVHAMMPGHNASTNHANNYRNMPDELKAQYPTYDTYEYIMLELDDGQRVYVGLPWIVEGSLYLEDSRRVNLVLKDFRDPNGDRVISILRQNGYIVESFSDFSTQVSSS